MVRSTENLKNIPEKYQDDDGPTACSLHYNEKEKNLKSKDFCKSTIGEYFKRVVVRILPQTM
jgi:hypothetical protein